MKNVKDLHMYSMLTECTTYHVENIFILFAFVQLKKSSDVRRHGDTTDCLCDSEERDEQ